MPAEPKHESPVVYASPSYATVSASRPALPPVEEIPSPYAESPSPYAVTGSVDKTVARERVETTVSTVSEYAVVVKEKPKTSEKTATGGSSGADELRDFLRTLGETDFTSTEPVSLEAAETSFKQLRDLVESID